MVSINNINSSQLNTLLNSTNSSESKTGINQDIKSETKQDFLDISTQIEIMNNGNAAKMKKYEDIENKLGIDSNKWGVEAISDDIFNFAKILYDNYKLNHKGEENQEVLDGFYNMSKKSITQGYEEAMGIVGGINKDADSLSKATFDRTIEKLDAWYENGGIEPEKTEIDKDVNESKIENFNETSEKPRSELSNLELERYENNRKIIETLLEDASNIKNDVVDLLKQQGIYLNEEATKISSFDIKS